MSINYFVSSLRLVLVAPWVWLVGSGLVAGTWLNAFFDSLYPHRGVNILNGIVAFCYVERDPRCPYDVFELSGIEC